MASPSPEHRRSKPLDHLEAREIAMLAASGRSNKQIGQRLFPKLGITSRAALRDALDALPPEMQRGGT